MPAHPTGLCIETSFTSDQQSAHIILVKWLSIYSKRQKNASNRYRKRSSA
jgi:hypothetical protein